MTGHVEELLQLGRDIIQSLRSPDPGASELETQVARRGEMLAQLNWGGLTVEQAEQIRLQNSSLVGEADRLQDGLLKATCFNLAARKPPSNNLRAYGRFCDART